jgi:hypothetical protein
MIQMRSVGSIRIESNLIYDIEIIEVFETQSFYIALHAIG